MYYSWRMSAPVPICYVISSITTGAAGTEGHVLRLIRGLDRSRFAPHLISLQSTDWTKTFTDPSFPFTAFDFKSFKIPTDWRIILQLRRYFRERQIKLVELYFTDAHFAGALGAKLAGVEAIISARRNLGYQYTANTLRLSRAGNRFVTRFVANARQVAKVIASREGIDEQRFSIIHNGIDLPAFDEALKRQPPREFLDFISGKKVVALAANLRPVKNVQGFLTACYQVAQERDDVVFVIMGSGPDELSLKSFAQEMGIGARVFWTGSVEATAPYLARADVGCLSSDSEGFSNAIIEYMSAGLPVVATRVGGAAESVIDSETGFLVRRGAFEDMARRILDLLNNTEEAQRLGGQGRARVEQRYTFEREVREYMNLYDELLGR